MTDTETKTRGRKPALLRYAEPTVSRAQGARVTLEQWAEIWTRLDNAENDINWARGQLVTEVTKKGDDSLREFATLIDQNYDSLVAYRQTWGAYDEDSRRLGLPWSIYQVFNSNPRRAEFIAVAATEKWSVKIAREVAKVSTERGAAYALESVRQIPFLAEYKRLVIKDDPDATQKISDKAKEIFQAKPFEEWTLDAWKLAVTNLLTEKASADREKAAADRIEKVRLEETERKNEQLSRIKGEDRQAELNTRIAENYPGREATLEELTREVDSYLAINPNPEDTGNLPGTDKADPPAIPKPRTETPPADSTVPSGDDEEIDDSSTNETEDPPELGNRFLAWIDGEETEDPTFEQVLTWLKDNATKEQWEQLAEYATSPKSEAA